MAAAACLLGLLLATFGSLPISAQTFVSPDGSYGGQIDTPPNLSPSCAATFSEAVVCDPMLWQVAQNKLPNADDLELMCTTPSCASSLEALRELQLAQCTDTDNITVGYKVYPPTYVVDLLLHSYKWACLTDTIGERCLALLMEQQARAENTLSSMDLCSDCMIRLYQAVLDSPLGYTWGRADDYSSLTSSCQVTGYPVTSPARYALGTTTMSIPTPTGRVPIPSYTCESKYTIRESDTCESISWLKQVSTFSLLYLNHLPMFCAGFPEPGSEICIPQQCNTYTVMPIDTCQTVANANGLTITALIELNPNLTPHCGDLSTFLGHNICLSPPGVVSSSATPEPTTTTAYFTNPCRNPGAPSSCFTTEWETAEYDIPWPTRATNKSTSTSVTWPAYTDPASRPRAPGTREDCVRYDDYDPQLARYVTGNACWWRANFWGVTHEQLMEWNPSLSYDVEDQSTWSSCQFEEGYSYCVEV